MRVSGAGERVSCPISSAAERGKQPFLMTGAEGASALMWQGKVQSAPSHTLTSKLARKSPRSGVRAPPSLSVARAPREDERNCLELRPERSVLLILIEAEEVGDVASELREPVLSEASDDWLATTAAAGNQDLLRQSGERSLGKGAQIPWG